VQKAGTRELLREFPLGRSKYRYKTTGDGVESDEVSESEYAWVAASR
jgi:hypothetical protein